MAGGNFGGGDGTVLNPFIIEDRDDFATAAGHTNNTNSMSYSLKNDIDLAGLLYSSPPMGVYSGAFDGQGFKIKNFKIISSVLATGFFGGLGGAGTIRNLHLENVHVETTAGNANSYAGGFVAGNTSSSSVISGCSASGVVIGALLTDNVGGFIGKAGANSLIANCYSECSVLGNSNVGGFIGNFNGSKILNCYSTGSVRGTTRVGGFSGSDNMSSGSVTNCYSLGTVHGVSYVGGFSGGSTSFTTDNCYALCPYIERTSGTASTFYAFSASPSVVGSYALEGMEGRG